MTHCRPRRRPRRTSAAPPATPRSRSSAASPPGSPGTSALPVLWVRVGVRARRAARRPRRRASTPACGWCCRRTRRFETEAPGLESATRGGRRPGRIRRLGDVGPAIALAALGVRRASCWSRRCSARARSSGRSFIGVVGVALLWRQADEAQRERWLDTTGRIDPVRVVLGSGGWASYARLAAGVALIVARAACCSRSAAARSRGPRRHRRRAAGRRRDRRSSSGPWIYRLASDLTAERAERVRTQERADVAAHLHDSVLQTLALIQKNAGDGDHRRPAGPGPGARPARLAVRRRGDRREHRGQRPARRRGRDRGRARGLRRGGQRRGLRPRRAAAAGRRRRRRGGHQRRQARGHRPDRRVRRGDRRRRRRLRPRPGPRLRPGGDRRPTGTACGTASSTGWHRHGGTAEVRSTPGEGTEVRLHLPRRPTDRRTDE